MIDKFEYDIFISFAYEDQKVAAQLSQELQYLGLTTWFSSEKLTLGSSIVDSINQALMKSKFAVIVLSPKFLKKSWAMSELKALFNMQQARKTKMILPVRYHLSSEVIQREVPLIADLYAIDFGKGLMQVANIINQLVKGEMSNARLFDAESSSPFINTSVECYISCALKDEKVHDELRDYLLPISERYEIKFRSQFDIGFGKNMRKERIKMLTAANLVLLLVSTSYLKSSQMRKELSSAAKLIDSPNKLGVLIPIHTCGWDHYTELNNLIKWPLYYGMPTPIQSWENRNDAFIFIANSIGRLLA